MLMSAQLSLVKYTENMKEVRIYDVQGRWMRTYEIRNSESLLIDKNELEAGIYFVHVLFEEGGREVVKMVVNQCDE